MCSYIMGFRNFNALLGIGTAVLLSGSVHGFDYLYGTRYADGTVVRFDAAGNGSVFASGLHGPTGLTFDQAGNLYVANMDDNTIVKIAPNGSRSVFAAAGLSGPFGLAFDGSGNLYAANASNGTITKYDSQGHFSVFANAGLSTPWSMAFDSHGDLFVVNYVTDHEYITKFNPAGEGTLFVTTSAGLSGPYGLGFDAGDNLYISNFHSNNIIRIDPGGHSTVVVSGLSFPAGLAVDTTGNVFIADLPYQIEVVSPSGQRTQFASSPFGLIAQMAFAPVPEPSAVSLLCLGALWFGSRFGRSVARPPNS